MRVKYFCRRLSCTRCWPQIFFLGSKYPSMMTETVSFHRLIFSRRQLKGAESRKQKTGNGSRSLRWKQLFLRDERRWEIPFCQSWIFSCVSFLFFCSKSDRERPWRPDDESITCLFRSRQSKHRLHPRIAPVPGSAAGVRTLHLSKNVSGRLLCGGFKRPPTQSLLFAENKQPEQISHSSNYC